MKSKEAKVLIVDDEPGIRSAFALLLKKEKLPVLTARNGIEALEMLQKEDINLVLTDLDMPKMNGIELLENMREKEFDIPTIIITGRGDIPSTVYAIQLGAINFISKPIPPKDFIEMVNKGLAHSRMLVQLQLSKKTETNIQTVYREMMKGSQGLQYSCSFKVGFTFEYLIEAAIKMFDSMADMGGYRGHRRHFPLVANELVANAVNYGAFEIDSSLRDKGDGSFEQVVKQRYMDRTHCNKEIVFSFEVDVETFRVKVKDPGKGFNWKKLPKEMDDESLERLHGRGVFLMRTMCHDVSWNNAGNEVVVVMRVE